MKCQDRSCIERNVDRRSPERILLGLIGSSGLYPGQEDEASPVKTGPKERDSVVIEHTYSEV